MDAVDFEVGVEPGMTQRLADQPHTVELSLRFRR